VVYTVAISATQPEYLEAMRRGLPLISRANYMGYLMEAYRVRIGVAGTHGKSTTTGMLTSIYMAADADPTVLCGAKVPCIDSAFREGGMDTMLFEACEYMDSFLDFCPTVALILNAELDHVDYFRDFAQMQRSFAAYADRVGDTGTVITNADDRGATEALAQTRGRLVTFGVEQDADYRATQISVDSEGVGQQFSLVCRGEYLGRISLGVTGRHNVYNALAAAAAARESGICMRAITAGLASFGGVSRRMEYKGMLGSAAVYDDYAHHPTEIRASIDAARALCRKRLVCVFQSHTYSRTAALFDDFAAALSRADRVIVAPIYAAREQNTSGVREAALAEAIRQRGTPACHGESLADTAALLHEQLQDGDTVLIMGAGDIDRMYPLLFPCV
jgi:UDP-N-acetylmuramate--alanine ligase